MTETDVKVTEQLFLNFLKIFHFHKEGDCLSLVHLNFSI